ncbi:MAG: lytic transglycosylase domain-containing protein [Ruminococcaceae bacterium]|nr:lytic transglycosylase domain-containing protein [Oscillospiraceae bacterium]
MRFKNTIIRSIVIITILVLSLICGSIYQAVWHRIDLNNHPREYTEFVEKYAVQYGVPEYIVYAVIKNESDFSSNKLSEDGEIGLMQISPKTFEWLLTLTKENLDKGILYDPETNIRYGTYMLSYLFTEYSRWTTVFAIYDAGENTVNEWMEDPTLVDDIGNLKKIPDKDVDEYVKSVEETMEIYQKLYYSVY